MTDIWTMPLSGLDIVILLGCVAFLLTMGWLLGSAWERYKRGKELHEEHKRLVAELDRLFLAVLQGDSE